MSTFGRTFAIEDVTDPVLKANPWFADMLRNWRPAGDAIYRDGVDADNRVSTGQARSEESNHLRLAIRHRYVNLYRGGQSIARVHFVGGALRASIHNKYVYGDKCDNQDYVTLSLAGFQGNKKYEDREYRGAADLKCWIENANGHVGDEKKFVDAIVAHNADTIDLEMALPAYSPAPRERIAPRMDLVALEPAGDRWQIVFWEAKLVDDPRLRCRGDGSPEVVDQLKRYTSWLGYENHCELVASAYQNACRLLVAFRGLVFERLNCGIGKLGPGIVAAANAGAPPLLVDRKPRLVIENLDNRDTSFERNGHLQKLRGAPHNIHVQMVTGHSDMTLEKHH